MGGGALNLMQIICLIERAEADGYRGLQERGTGKRPGQVFPGKRVALKLCGLRGKDQSNQSFFDTRMTQQEMGGVIG
jgi:hypothetical protein